MSTISMVCFHFTPALLCLYFPVSFSTHCQNSGKFLTSFVASLQTRHQQVVFAHLVASCRQVGNKLLTTRTIMLVTSDLLQGCSNKFDAVMI